MGKPQERNEFRGDFLAQKIVKSAIIIRVPHPWAFQKFSPLLPAAHTRTGESPAWNLPPSQSFPRVHSEQRLQRGRGFPLPLPGLSLQALHLATATSSRRNFLIGSGRIWFGVRPPGLDPHTLLRTQDSSGGDHSRERMTPSRALILGILALTTALSPCGGQDDIQGELPG